MCICIVNVFFYSYNKTFSGNISLDDNELSSVMKISKLSLDENIRNVICETIEEKLHIQNVTSFYQIAKIFNLSSIHVKVFSCIKTCFTMVVDTPNFLELDFTHLSKIFRSSKLSITSEREVYDAAENWLKYNFEERREFAKQLLLTVRLPLLSDHSLKYLIDNSSSFSKIKECKAVLIDVLNNKDNYYHNKATVCYTSRYCNQGLYSILVCGGQNATDTAVNNMKQLNATNLNYVNVLSVMLNNRRGFKAVCLKGEVYVFGGTDAEYNLIRTVDRYSPATNKWVKVADMENEHERFRCMVMYEARRDFCACVFMDKIFIIGGFNRRYRKHYSILYDTCVQFDTKNSQWEHVARMNERKKSAACVVFEEKVIVTGGVGYDEVDEDEDDDDYFERDHLTTLNTAESYDVAGNVWTQMPNMREKREGHSLVVVKNKLFVVGGRGSLTSEVFDNNSKTFVSLKSEFLIGRDKALSVGSKIVIFDISEYLPVAIYDVHKNEWSEEPCETAEHFINYYCAKLPIYKQKF